MERKMDTINWGIIGAGGISTRFSKVLAGEKGMAVRAIYNRHIERARKLAESFPGCETFDSLDELLKREEIQAVYIGLTNDMHLPAAVKCMEAGKAVLCEKPMAMTEEDARVMAACAKANGVLLMEAMWTRFLPAYRRIREWMDAGRIGKVRQVEASFCFHMAYDPTSRLYQKQMGGGATYDVGVYSIEFVTGLLGRPNRVSGALYTGASGVDELSVVNLIYESGAIGTATSGVIVPAPARAAIYGDKGSIRIPDDFYRADRVMLYDAEGRLLEEFEDHFDDGFVYQIRHFGALMREGKKESDIMPLSDTIDCARIFDAVLTGKEYR